MRVLVTGATGFLGSHVVEELIARGHGVVGAARRAGPADPGGHAGNPEGPGDRRSAAPSGRAAGRAVGRGGATEALAVDLALPGAAERLLREVQPEAVVNLAAVPDVAPCRADPAAAARLNTEVPGEIARWCAAHGARPAAGPEGGARAAGPAGGSGSAPRRLIHVSTDQVFDGSRGAWREEDEPAPLHDYGATKLAGERAVLAGCPGAVVLRPSLLTGRAPAGRRSGTSALLEALARGATPRMFTDELRSPLAAADFARVIADLLERPGAAGLFHCGGPEVLSRHALARREAERAGFAPDLVAPARRTDLGLASERPADLSLDSSRLTSLLGWAPRMLVDPEPGE